MRNRPAAMGSGLKRIFCCRSRAKFMRLAVFVEVVGF
jgi:hypothetical protein